MHERRHSFQTDKYVSHMPDSFCFAADEQDMLEVKKVRKICYTQDIKPPAFNSETHFSRLPEKGWLLLFYNVHADPSNGCGTANPQESEVSMIASPCSSSS